MAIRKFTLIVAMVALLATVLPVAPFSSVHKVMAQTAEVPTCDELYQDSMIGYWNFDHTNDLMVPFIGTLRGTMVGPITWDYGKVGRALEFNGGAYVNYGTGLDIPAWDSYTVSIWFLNDGRVPWVKGYGQKIIDKTTWYSDWFITLQNHSDPALPANLVFMYDTSFKNIQTGGYGYNDSQWHHAVITKSGTHGELWVDGLLIGAKDDVNPTINNQPLLLGYSLSGDGYQRVYWGGLLDEFAVFNRALSAAEITDLYQRSANGESYCVVDNTIIVNSTADPGDGVCDVMECTLHEAIAAANAIAGPDEIAFAISGLAPHVITLNEPLPSIVDSVLIDGYSQPGAYPSTSTDPADLDGVLMIEIDGHNLPIAPSVIADGLRINGAQITIRGLAIHSLSGAGIMLGGAAQGTVIEGNFLGADTTGNSVHANGVGIAVVTAASADAPNRIVGNLIVGNGDGIRIEQSSNVLVERNLIGLAKSGEPLGNGIGIFSVESSPVTINQNLITQSSGAGISAQRAAPTIADNEITDNGTGISCMVNGACVITHNHISRNRGIGIDLGAGEGTIVQENRMTLNGSSGLRLSFRSGPYFIDGNHFNANGGNALTVDAEPLNLRALLSANNYFGPNGGLGIDLQDDGVTLNDPGDDDIGVNGLQNFPTISLASLGHPTRVAGILNSKPNAEFTLVFYRSFICDPSGFGEGSGPLGNATIRTDAKGFATYDLYLQGQTFLGDYVTATATGAEGTSEFSSCRYTGTELVNDQFTLQTLTDRYDSTPTTYAPAGIMQINATFVNNGSPIKLPYARVATLSNENLLLNADDGPGGVGTVLSGPAVIESGGSFTLNFTIGLHARERFDFYIDLYGFDLAGLGSATPDPAYHLKFNISVDEAGLEGETGTTQQIFFPLIHSNP